jgi:Flp pilus assembly protein TadD
MSYTSIWRQLRGHSGALGLARTSHTESVMSARRPSSQVPEETREASLRRRACRNRRRGDGRAAMLALRQAAHENEGDAKLWTLYGVQCARVGRMDDAESALVHAVWLRDRRREPGKAAVTRAVLARLVGERAA